MTRPPAHPRNVGTLLIALTLAACGGQEAAEPPPEEGAANATATAPTLDDALTADDLGALTLEQVRQVIPWTQGRIRNQGSEQVPAGTLLAAELSAEAGFDRLSISYEGEGSRVGYAVQTVGGPAEGCGAEPIPYEQGGEAWLSVQLFRLEAAADRLSGIVGSPSMNAIREIRLVCREGAALELAVALPGRLDYRVLEARDPSRVVVDIRH